MLRILLADDHGIFRAGLRRILESEFPDVYVGDAATTAETLEKVNCEDWDLLILDISLAENNSLNILPSLKQARPKLPVIMLSMYGERQFVIRALKSGASAYITKEHAPDELLRAIRAVFAGRRYVGETLMEHLADYLAMNENGDPHQALSPREFEIFLLLAAAKSVSEIANKLGLSVKTVSTNRSKILEKMALHSNAEIMQYAIRLGLVS